MRNPHFKPLIDKMPYSFFLSKALLFVLAFFSFSSRGKIFRAPYVSFDIEYDWICKSFGSDWVCHHYLYKGARPSFMLIAAKKGGNLDNSISHYSQMFKGESTGSLKPIHIKKILVNRHEWMESLYTNHSSIKIFNRYAATICCDSLPLKFHIMAGFYAYEENYTKYANEFLKSIKSLRLVKNIKSALKRIGQTEKQRQEMLSYIEKILLDSDLEKSARPKKDEKTYTVFISLSALVIFILFFSLFYLFYYKKNPFAKKRKKYRKKPS